MDRRRILILVGFVIIVLLLGFALYRVFFAAKKPPATLPPEAGELLPGQFPPAAPGAPTGREEIAPGVLPSAEARPGAFFQPGAPTAAAAERQVVDSRILNLTITPQGNAQFYNRNDGKFYRVQSDGTVLALSDTVFYNVDRVTWSPNDFESIIEYPDGANIYYNFQTKRQVTLPQHWEGFSFSESGDRVAAKSIGLSPENRWLISAAPDGANIQFIEALGENAHKVKVDWSPTRKIVALSRTGNSLGSDRQEVLLIGQNKENFKSLTVEGRGLQSQWSPQGQQLLYSVYSARSDYKPELWIVNADGDLIDTNRRPILLNTWADKCAFASERYVYCGVPVELPVGAGFEPVIADNTPDQIYRIDLQTGSKTTIATDAAHVIDQIFVSSDGQTVHFTDKTQLGLFSLDL